MMDVFQVYRVKNVYTQSGHLDGREDELHMEIVGLGRMIVPKSELRRIADALLDANTIGRLRSSGKQPEPSGKQTEPAPGPAKEYLQSVHDAFDVYSALKELDEPDPTNRERADELFSELLLKLHPDHGIKLIELVGLYQPPRLP